MSDIHVHVYHAQIGANILVLIQITASFAPVRCEIRPRLHKKEWLGAKWGLKQFEVVCLHGSEKKKE